MFANAVSNVLKRTLTLVEGKTNLLRLRQQIPLNDAKLDAVQDGVEAMEKLLQQLSDIHTPDSAMAREQDYDRIERGTTF